jgi:CHAT domain-containing protein
MILSEGKRLRVLDLLGKPVFMNSRMAVLSSCQTAMIDFSKIPEEAVGLPAGFLQAGMPAVVSTLWEVEDLSTAMLMIRFYQYLFQEDRAAISEPMKPADALRQAQLWLRGLSAQGIDDFVETFLPTHIGRARLRKDDTFSHPYYWAGFTLNGV